MTPNEITTLIATREHKELDVPFKKIIYERVKYWRSTLIKQTLDKTRQDARHFRQTIYLPLERINYMEMTTPLPLTDWRARTTVDVPLPLRITDAGVFNYVGAIDGKSPWGFADAGMLNFMKAGKYSRTQIFAQYENNRILTSDEPDIPMVMIQGVFNEPEEAMKWQTGTFNPLLDWWNLNIPMSGDIEQRVVQCIYSVDFAPSNKDNKKAEDYQIPMNGEQQ
jgi:hypothetical protein